MNQYFGFIM